MNLISNLRFTEFSGEYEKKLGSFVTDLADLSPARHGQGEEKAEGRTKLSNAANVSMDPDLQEKYDEAPGQGFTDRERKSGTTTSTKDSLQAFCERVNKEETGHDGDVEDLRIASASEDRKKRTADMLELLAKTVDSEYSAGGRDHCTTHIHLQLVSVARFLTFCTLAPEPVHLQGDRRTGARRCCACR